MREDMKSLIADTFTQMLDKEDIDKITVTKLIGECHISRQTFYYHFKDILVWQVPETLPGCRCASASRRSSQQAD